MMVENIRSIAWIPLTTKGEFVWIIPIILGVLLYARFTRKHYWFARYPLAFIVALGTAISSRTIVTSDFIVQMRDTMINPLVTSGPGVVGTPSTPINNILIIIVVVSTLCFFIFSGGTTLQKFAPMRWINTAGRYFMMFAFGAAFGNTIMTRVAFMIERVRYVVQPDDWPFLPFIMAMVAVAMVPKEWIRRPRKA
jgi:hypothetical protein